jgi:hypothetical protein
MRRRDRGVGDAKRCLALEPLVTAGAHRNKTNRSTLSDLVDLFVLKSHVSLDHQWERVHALPNRVHALAFEDDDSSGAGCCPRTDSIKPSPLSCATALISSSINRRSSRSSVIEPLAIDREPLAIDRVRLPALNVPTSSGAGSLPRGPPHGFWEDRELVAGDDDPAAARDRSRRFGPRRIRAERPLAQGCASPA